MRILTGLIILVATSVASAQIVFAPSFSYFTQKLEDNGTTTSDTKMTFYDFRLGYLHSSGLYLGGMYSMTNFDSGSGGQKGFAAGPTIGFSHYSGFYALFTYFLMAEQDLDATTKYTDGMGPQVDVGWAFPVTAMFHLGPQITYRSISYDKIDVNGSSQTADATWSNIIPAINLWFNF